MFLEKITPKPGTQQTAIRALITTTAKPLMYQQPPSPINVFKKHGSLDV
jgi:hypothetical protein